MNEFLQRTYGPWQIPVVSFLAIIGGLAAGIAVRRLVLPLVARAARRSAWQYDDILIEAARGPVVLWGTLLGLRLAVVLARLPERTDRMLAQAIMVLGVISVTWFIGRFAGQAMTKGRASGAPAVTLLANLVRAVLFVVGALIILDNLGISITPVITALGVGGLAVGLALQDTLSNFFAGVRILAAGTIRPGDFVRLESGQEGFVQDITWGQTTIRQTANNIVIVPNSKLSQAIVINFSAPTPPQVVVVPVGVAYGSDLELVERVTLEVAAAAQRDLPVGVAEYEPAVRFHTLADSSINLNVVLQARSYDERFLLQHEFLKRLVKRYAAEGIEIPYPVRTVITKDARS